jgi:predicted 3-demethylubiquinone-9 3-methyltransferase (glyoxalase superfamily)
MIPYYKTAMQKIIPHLWYDKEAKEAAEFYTSLFPDSKVTNVTTLHNTPSGDSDIVSFQLQGYSFMAISAGPFFKLNPSISFMLNFDPSKDKDARQRIDELWAKLLDGGKALMSLDTYPFSEHYGWVQDKYGVSWQVYTGDKSQTPQKFCSTLMFTGDNAGKAEKAVHFYTDLFPQSNIQGVLKYRKEDDDNEEFVKHAQFKIKDFVAMAMDSSANHGFGFTDVISLVVECENQEEIDKYWGQLTANGGKEVACGWLTDPFGISWQIIPKALNKLVSDPVRGQRIMGALMKMKKLIIADLENA